MHLHVLLMIAILAESRIIPVPGPQLRAVT